jgi:ribosomal protein S2
MFAAEVQPFPSYRYNIINVEKKLHSLNTVLRTINHTSKTANIKFVSTRTSIACHMEPRFY